MQDYSAQQHEIRERADRAEALAAQAYARLLHLAETRDSGQILKIAAFIAATYNGQSFPLDLFILRTVDYSICEDMLLCIDALRWGRNDLYKLVPDGARRIEAICEAWGLHGMTRQKF